MGNVLGSNLFNMLGILGVTALVSPLAPQGISWPTLGVMVGSAGLVAGMALTGTRITRIEGGGLLLLYGAYVTWLVVGG